MSQLSVFRPSGVDDSPRILSFALFAARVKSDHIFDVVTRAKLEHHNRVCPACGRVTVQPIELDDPLLNRNGAVIPRTATLAGFSCRTCGHSWSV
jgi:predicted RNA-binding Zn-ribbon protein involved in translation (DUF1610 family)